MYFFMGNEKSYNELKMCSGGGGGGDGDGGGSSNNDAQF
jgi:hypothetical protein